MTTKFRLYLIEIIALLWLIAGYTVGGWFKWVGISFFIENLIEAIVMIGQARRKLRKDTL